jgi:hypothetical protein
MTDVPDWEKANDLKINVYAFENGELQNQPLYVNPEFKEDERTIDLLLISDDKGNAHFVWIKEVNALFSSKTSGRKKYLCRQCAGAACFPTLEELKNI